MSDSWTQERIDQLIELWRQGHSAAEIGRRIGVTKNAVVGKVHRMGLPKRPSPIKRDPNAQRPVRKVRVREDGNVVTLNTLKPGMCSWPEGEPGEPGFRFCGKETVPGKPYCHDHCAKAYVKSSKGPKVATPAEEPAETEAA
jgi:GcrA cell cycle regulator